MYGDLCMDHVRRDGLTLLKDFRCGTIVFINNLSLKDERLEQRPVEFARARELFVAARGITCCCYVSTTNIPFRSRD